MENEQLDLIPQEFFYTKSHNLGYDYMKDRGYKYETRSIYLEDHVINASSLEDFKEQLSGICISVKNLIDNYLDRDLNYTLDSIVLDEYEHHCGTCGDYIYTTDTINIKFRRFETEDEFINRQEINKKNIEQNLASKLDDLKCYCKLNNIDPENYLKC